MKTSYLFSRIIRRSVLATCLLLSAAVASAATVSISPVSQDVTAGDIVTVDIIATALVAVTGGSMDIAWDPAVLTMVDVVSGVSIATPPWDDPDISPFSDRGILSPGLLSAFRVGNFFSVSGDAAIATLTFTAASNPFDSSTLITIADGAGPGGGWSSPGILYESGAVNVAGVVPVPAAVWLFGSGLLGLVGMAKRK